MASHGTTWTLPAIFQSAAFAASVQAMLKPPANNDQLKSPALDVRPADRSQVAQSSPNVPTVVLNPAYISTASTMYHFDPHTSLLPTANQHHRRTTKVPVGPNYRELSAQQKQLQAQRCLAEARNCSTQGQYKEALTQCHRAVQLAPTLVDGYVVRARILFEQQYFEPAFKDLQSAFDLMPSHPEASRLLDLFMDQLPYDAATKAARELGEALMFRDLVLPGPPTATAPCSSAECVQPLPPPLPPPAPSTHSVHSPPQTYQQSPRPLHRQREPLHRPCPPHPHLTAEDRPPKRSRRSRRHTWTNHRHKEYQQSPTSARSPSPSPHRQHRRVQPRHR
ncbi:hypothetical protein H4R35_000293 [Dimargaris xerosporica]|nr:hypothetical protein H4R35_000293 [Dimargaris xerosporica]